MQKQLDKTTMIDSTARFISIFKTLQPVVLDFISSSSDLVTVLKQWMNRCSELALEAYVENRDSYTVHPDATLYLGTTSCRMYKFVRHDLGVPFLRTQHLVFPASTEAGNSQQSHADGSQSPETARTGHSSGINNNEPMPSKSTDQNCNGALKPASSYDESYTVEPSIVA